MIDVAVVQQKKNRAAVEAVCVGTGVEKAAIERPRPDFRNIQVGAGILRNRNALDTFGDLDQLHPGIFQLGQGFCIHLALFLAEEVAGHHVAGLLDRCGQRPVGNGALRLGKNDIQCRDLGAVVKRQILDQLSGHLARPWPASELLDALVVNRHNDHVPVRFDRPPNAETGVLHAEILLLERRRGLLVQKKRADGRDDSEQHEHEAFIHVIPPL